MKKFEEFEKLFEEEQKKYICPTFSENQKTNDDMLDLMNYLENEFMEMLKMYHEWIKKD